MPDAASNPAHDALLALLNIDYRPGPDGTPDARSRLAADKVLRLAQSGKALAPVRAGPAAVARPGQ